MIINMPDVSDHEQLAANREAIRSRPPAGRLADSTCGARLVGALDWAQASPSTRPSDAGELIGASRRVPVRTGRRG